MSNIDLVTSNVNAMSVSLAVWNKIVIFFVAATAIVAALYFVASYIAQRKAEQLDNAKNELIRLKDQDQALQIASLNAEAAKAKEGIAVAQAEAATANQKAESERLARLQLEARVGTRVIDKNKFLAALKDKPKPQAVIIKRSAAAGDGWFVALQLDELLREAGWPVVPGFDAPRNVIASDQSFNVGPAVARDGASSGIIVLYRYGSATPNEHGPFEALLFAIRDTLGAISGGQHEGIPDGTIWVIIFPRP